MRSRGTVPEAGPGGEVVRVGRFTVVMPR
jgi:hypothetical protein